MKIYGDKIYEKQFSVRGWGKYPSEEVIRFFMRSKERLDSTKIKTLDLGCGIGACTWFMAKEGAVVTAMDGAPSGLKKVKKLANEFGVDDNITIVNGDITRPRTFIESTFNIILDSYALYSNKENKTINGYKECFEILEDDGFFLTCCFGKKTDGFRAGKKISDNTYTNIKGSLSNGGVQSFFNREQLNNILIDIGYHIEYCENIIEDRNGEIIEKHITCLSK